jgi:hypothetical protein
MRDEIDGRLWAEHGSEFSQSISEFFDKLSFAWRRLNERQYATPWKSKESCCTSGRT